MRLNLTYICVNIYLIKQICISIIDYKNDLYYYIYVESLILVRIRTKIKNYYFNVLLLFIQAFDRTCLNK